MGMKISVVFVVLLFVFALHVSAHRFTRMEQLSDCPNCNNSNGGNAPCCSQKSHLKKAVSVEQLAHKCPNCNGSRGGNPPCCKTKPPPTTKEAVLSGELAVGENGSNKVHYVVGPQSVDSYPTV